jgi:tryptophan 6-halogenase
VTSSPRLVILGGGTVGWMAACLFAQAWPQASVTVIESPEIGIVGVGEGSTPQLRAFFATLGIAEREWMPACGATYKAGIEFRGWSQRAGHERYFHPFASALDPHTQPQFHYSTLARRRGADVPAHPDRFFVNTALARARLAPIPPDNFPFDIGYGYHFDAQLVGAFLRAHAVSRGVAHLARRVTEVAVSESGEVLHLVAEGGEKIGGELFVDASGFRSVIVQEALGVPFLPFAANLFNDRAVVMRTPRPDDAIAPQTVSTALSNGWAWSIPLNDRTGNGYVYASSYCTADQAESELRRHLGLGDSDVAARHLTMKVGRVERSWHANSLAIGLAQGFIEPLEATALHIVQATVEGFIRAWEEGGFTPAHRERFNAQIARRYEGVRDYIVAHFRLNQRHDTPYWRDNATHDRLSGDLKAIMTAWFTGADVPALIEQRGLAGYYAPLSWECLFAGYGTFPDQAQLQPAPDRVGLAQLDDFIARCLLNFGDHAAALDRLAA